MCLTGVSQTFVIFSTEKNLDINKGATWPSLIPAIYSRNALGPATKSVLKVISVFPCFLQKPLKEIQFILPSSNFINCSFFYSSPVFLEPLQCFSCLKLSLWLSPPTSLRNHAYGDSFLFFHPTESCLPSIHPSTDPFTHPSWDRQYTIPKILIVLV